MYAAVVGKKGEEMALNRKHTDSAFLWEINMCVCARAHTHTHTHTHCVVGSYTKIQGKYLLALPGNSPAKLPWKLLGQEELISFKKNNHKKGTSACMLSCFSYVQLFVILGTIAHQAPLAMGLSRKEYWSGLPCFSPGDLPDPGVKLVSLMSPALTDGFFITRATWEAPWTASSVSFWNIHTIHLEN